jgi:hypothetical protein
MNAPGFDRWLAAQTRRRDAVGTLARQARDGEVRLDRNSLAASRSLLTNARVEFEKSLRSPTKPNRSKASATRSAKTGTCPGCGQVADELVVDTKSSGRSSRKVWHRSCHDKNRGRSAGRGLHRTGAG